MLRSLVLVTFALLVTIVAGWLWRDRWPGPPPHALRTYQETQLAADAAWRDVVLTEGPSARTPVDIVEALKWQASLAVFVSWAEIELEGIDAVFRERFSVPIRTAGVRAGDLLDQLVAALADPRIDWRWRDDVLVISTRDDLREVQVQVFDVRDSLIGSRVLWWLRRLFAERDELLARREADLIAAIQGDIEPASWTSVGNIQSWQGSLVIRQSEDNVYAIEDWLWRARARRLAIDLFLVAVVAAILGWVASSPFSLRRRRLKAGKCPACGYDLRASPGDCPECGRPAQRELSANPA